MNLKKMQALLYAMPFLIIGFLVGGVLLFDRTKIEVFFYLGLGLAIASGAVIFCLQHRYWRCPVCKKPLPGRRSHLVTQCPHCQAKLGLEPIGVDIFGKN